MEARPGADQHRHVGPVDAVLEVRPAQQVGEVLGLGPLGVEGAHLDPAVRQPLGDRGRRKARALRVDAAGQRQPRRRPAARRSSRRAPNRRLVRSTATSAGPPVGAGELRGEVEDAAHVGAAEGVDRLVRVADDGEVAAVAGERTQQRDLAGVGVLVLVDEHVAQPGAQLVAVPLGLHDGAGDEVGVVDGAGAVEDVEVLRQEPSRGDVRVDAVVETEPGQLLGPQPLLARPRRSPRGPRARSRGCRPPGAARPARSPTRARR